MEKTIVRCSLKISDIISVTKKAMHEFGDFTWHPDPFMRREGPIAIKVLNQTPRGWDMLNKFNGQSFMWHATPHIMDIMTSIDNESRNHSGTSLSLLMRHMETIAKKGWNYYVNSFTKI